MAKTIKESRAAYTVSIDTTKPIAKPVVLKRAGRRIAALVPIAEYDQFVNWRKRQQRPRRKPVVRPRKRASKHAWITEQEKILNQEFAVYERMKPELLKTHKDKWVAIHNGELVDFDDDETLLLERVDSRFGDITMLVTQVTETLPVYHVNSPKLVRR